MESADVNVTGTYVVLSHLPPSGLVNCPPHSAGTRSY